MRWDYDNLLNFSMSPTSLTSFVVVLTIPLYSICTCKHMHQNFEMTLGDHDWFTKECVQKFFNFVKRLL